MEADLFLEPGSILFAWGSSMKSSRDYEILDVVGSIDLYGYHEDIRDKARFNTISNFIQVSKSKVIIVDQYNGCLRELDRLTGATSHYAGRCAARGYADGDANHTQFNNPSDILLDVRSNNALIVVDDANSALRSIEMTTKSTTTIIRDTENLKRPRFATFNNYDSNILYVTVKFQIIKVSLADQTLSVVFGSQVPRGFADGSFHEALIGYWPAEILQIDKSHLAVADFWNHNVRLLDLSNKKVKSLCRTEINGTFTNGIDCNLQNPHSLLLQNDTLFVGDSSDIYLFPG